MPYHTFALLEERDIKVLISGIPSRTDPEIIKKELESLIHPDVRVPAPYQANVPS